MNLSVGALKRVDSIGANGVLIQTVLSGLMERARRGMERDPHGGWEMMEVRAKHLIGKIY